MGWMQKCCQTYDNNVAFAGKITEGATLCPLYFITQKAQIEVTLREDGSFVSATAVRKGEEDTLIPVTERSASRSSGVCAHPLCDQLIYFGLGHPNYPDSDLYEEKYLVYRNGLQAWAIRADAHFLIKAVYAYCCSGNIVSDLSKAGVIACDETGRLQKGNINATAYEKCLIRWRVISDKGVKAESWASPELFANYAQYYEESLLTGDRALCYVTGEEAIIAQNHPKGIVRFANGAKLISANDSSGFTYRGRFSEAGQAYTVGAVTSQKAHSALRWLVANQAVFCGGRTFLCWNTAGYRPPDCVGSFRWMDEDEDEPSTPTTEPQYREYIKRVLRGHHDALVTLQTADRDVEIIALDAATTGRLSVTYYNELAGSDYLDRLERWQTNCCWFCYPKDGQWIIATPSLREIAEFAYGTQQGAFVKADDKVLREQVQLLIGCVVGGTRVSRSIVQALVARCSHPQAYEETNYRKLLYIACAMIRVYHNQLNQEVTMELDTNNKNRSYLFGRLLAVAEKAERATYGREDQGREPNAIRLQSAFVQHPMHTWKILEGALIPYYARLNAGSRKYYKDLIGEIVSSFDPADLSSMNKPLEDLYLIGYYLQRKELNTYTKKSESEEEN